MWMYSEKVREYLRNPVNAGVIENPDAVGEVGSPECGDALKLMLRIDDQEKILDARFQTFGCASAIAIACAMTEMIIGKTLSDVKNLTNADIVEFIGGLPDIKFHCSVMGAEALEAAIADYRKRKHEKQTLKQGGIVMNDDQKAMVKLILERQIRPALQQDGGDIELIDITDNKVQVSLQGACAHCPMATMTMKGFVEKQLKEAVSPDLEVESV
jgi:NifU-like protein